MISSVLYLIHSTGKREKLSAVCNVQPIKFSSLVFIVYSILYKVKRFEVYYVENRECTSLNKGVLKKSRLD